VRADMFMRGHMVTLVAGYRYLLFRTHCQSLEEGKQRLKALQAIVGANETRGLIVR